MEQVMSETSSDLDGFVDFLFDGLTGYVYLAAMIPGEPTSWMQEFFEFPTQKELLKRTVLAAKDSHEVYIAPAVFSKKSALREHFSMSNVIWADFDDNAPEFEGNITPSLIIQSSEEKRQHVYWRLTNPITDVEKLESLNRTIAYNFSADGSGWDANQVLRPPLTFNHKRQKPVSVRSYENRSFDPEFFDYLTPPPVQIEGQWEIGALPTAQDVILKYAFSPDMIKLLAKEKSEIKDRSASLMNLAYGLCQMGMTDTEVFTILLLADDRWEKFKGRKDREKRLSHIITVARNKYPSETSEDSNEPFTYALGFQSFLDSEISIDWFIEPMLMEQGYMIVVGPSGIGKTQISLWFMIHLALGRDYFHYKVPNPKKVLFMSLEMDHGSLKKFVEAMSNVLTSEDRERLEENLIIIPHGEPWALNTLEGQNELIPWLENVEPDILFVDSVGSAIRGNISSDDNVMPFLDFNDKIRKKYNLTTWFIHHMRKQQQGGNVPASQDDVYGNQYLVNRASSAYGFLRGKDGAIRVKNLKNRLAPIEESYLIYRKEHLTFEKSVHEVDELLEAEEAIVHTKLEPKAGNFDL